MPTNAFGTAGCELMSAAAAAGADAYYILRLYITGTTLQSTRAVLNISRESMARYGFSPATRVFEAAGAAACLITDEWEGIPMFLEPGKEVLVARDGDEVAEHVRRLSPERARSIGQAALERVLAEHTYDHRAKQLDAILAGGLSAVAGR